MEHTDTRSRFEPPTWAGPAVLTAVGLVAFLVAVVGLGVGTTAVAPAGPLWTVGSAAVAFGLPTAFPLVAVLLVVYLLESA